MELIGDYSKNPFYMLENDEEFTIVHYRLIKRKKHNLAGLDVKGTKDGDKFLKVGEKALGNGSVAQQAESGYCDE